jgi:hypothetical protein
LVVILIEGEPDVALNDLVAINVFYMVVKICLVGEEFLFETINLTKLRLNPVYQYKKKFFKNKITLF